MSIYRVHLKAAFGDVPLDRIDDGRIASFRASLVEKRKLDRDRAPTDEPLLSEKRINNIIPADLALLRETAPPRMPPGWRRANTRRGCRCPAPSSRPA